MARSKSAPACSAETRTRRNRPLTLPVAPPVRSNEFDRSRRRPVARAFPPARRGETSCPVPRRPPSADSAPPLPLPRAEAPSADESFPTGTRPASCFRKFPASAGLLPRRRAPESKVLADDSERMAATGTPGLATQAQLPARVHGSAHANPLDPPCFTGCSPEPASHMPPIDFCNRVSPRAHPAYIPNPVVRACEAPSNRQLAPWQGRAGRALSNQGSPGGCPSFRPPRSDRSPCGFTPIRFVESDTHLSRSWHRRRPDESTTAICGCDPSRREDQFALACQAETWPRPRPWLAVRAASLRTARTLRDSAAPRVPSTRPSSWRGARGAPPRGVAAQPAGFPGSAEPAHTTPL
jgi:hypothetical protein